MKWSELSGKVTVLTLGGCGLWVINWLTHDLLPNEISALLHDSRPKLDVVVENRAALGRLSAGSFDGLRLSYGRGVDTTSINQAVQITWRVTNGGGCDLEDNSKPMLLKFPATSPVLDAVVRSDPPVSRQETPQKPSIERDKRRIVLGPLGLLKPGESRIVDVLLGDPEPSQVSDDALVSLWKFDYRARDMPTPDIRLAWSKSTPAHGLDVVLAYTIGAGFGMFAMSQSARRMLLVLRQRLRFGKNGR